MTPTYLPPWPEIAPCSALIMLLVAAPMETIFSSTNLITWRTLGNADRAVAEADLALHVRQYFVGAKNNHEPGHEWVPGLNSATELGEVSG
ncbi:hypothetical protein ARMSODRAFT_963033 [Armillaria solidipes]|uniref:Uncharacterized protein n=1 Tax=Armillaria solidipes TaxID=1076256 RepID=A0A2H3AXJ1_9AGAR|nr:hypothetical protein ARMSODRAFT_963033 [Armillaria solidipes]